jgi:hypothetical protein
MAAAPGLRSEQIPEEPQDLTKFVITEQVPERDRGYCNRKRGRDCPEETQRIVDNAISL